MEKNQKKHNTRTLGKPKNHDLSIIELVISTMRSSKFILVPHKFKFIYALSMLTGTAVDQLFGYVR